jgi:hypothetical protein
VTNPLLSLPKFHKVSRSAQTWKYKGGILSHDKAPQSAQPGAASFNRAIEG